ncbi:winged helix DNA-binding domain-containing protein [uncultured Jatrophihabitans sp.]|uniref:winged helix DNA-binding domain-containing protein n=1 Tax=uncultured Jatrophihabitans sp. TaxID=1610747 RepID=UPI0035CC32B2
MTNRRSKGDVVRAITLHQRRRRLVARHRLAGDAADPGQVVRALVALHATDPASVYLSVLARSRSSTLDDVARAMYESRTLVRWMAMRRTLFVVARDDVPVVHAAAGITVARALRTQLMNRVNRAGTEPAITQDAALWLSDVGDAAVEALRVRGSATGTQLGADEPRLRTTIRPRTPSETAQNLTTSLLTVLGAEGRIVRGDPVGAWTSRLHRWEPIESRWPVGLPFVDQDDARRTLARRWLERFGPATIDDLQWWTGWSKTVTAQALTGLAVEEVDLHGRPGIALADDDVGDPDDAPPVAALLPALDPTPMGWKHRDWLFDMDPRQVFDRSGNIGPTVWWDGRIIGSWAVVPSGEIRTALVADHGAAAQHAVRTAAASLHTRLDGSVVTPAVRTPLERTLSRGSSN